MREGEQVISYEVGKFYEVPCVLVIANTGWAKPGDWIPVMGPKHEDGELLDFPWLHYHIDLRFLTKAQYLRVREFSTVLMDPDPTKTTRSSRVPAEGPPPYLDKIEQRKKRYNRELPPYPDTRAGWLPGLEAKYNDAELVCEKCPHRGIDLSTIKPINGIKLCPGHGLLWDAETGKMVSHNNPRLRGSWLTVGSISITDGSSSETVPATRIERS